MKYVRKKDCIYRDPRTGRIMEHKHYSTSIHWSKQMLDDLRRLYPKAPTTSLQGTLVSAPAR